MVNQCYLILITSVSEVNCGVDNLCKTNKSKGRRFYPNFGKHIPKNYFKVLLYNDQCCLAERECWIESKRDKPLDALLTCIHDCNINKIVDQNSRVNS